MSFRLGAGSGPPSELVINPLNVRLDLLIEMRDGLVAQLWQSASARITAIFAVPKK